MWLKIDGRLVNLAAATVIKRQGRDLVAVIGEANFTIANCDSIEDANERLDDVLAAIGGDASRKLNEILRCEKVGAR